MAAEKVLPEQLKKYIGVLSEPALESIKIPADAEVVNITDKFEEGGPIVVSYSRPRSPEERAEIHERIQRAANEALDDLKRRMQVEPGLLLKVMDRLGWSAEQQKPFIEKQRELFPETLVGIDLPT